MARNEVSSKQKTNELLLKPEYKWVLNLCLFSRCTLAYLLRKVSTKFYNQTFCSLVRAWIIFRTSRTPDNLSHRNANTWSARCKGLSPVFVGRLIVCNFSREVLKASVRAEPQKILAKNLFSESLLVFARMWFNINRVFV